MAKKASGAIGGASSTSPKSEKPAEKLGRRGTPLSETRQKPSSLLDTRVVPCGDNLERLAKLSIPSPFPNDPEAVVQRQLDAFNARDIDALLAAYAEDAQMFEHPSKLLASGSAAFRERYTARFQEPNLHATLLGRTVMGNFVVDHEEVTRTFPEGAGKIRLLMIYEVQSGRIAKAWSIAGARIMDDEA